METKQCKECQTDIPSKAKRCKNCGAKQPRHFWKNPWFYLVVVIIFPIIIGSISSNENNNSRRTSDNSSPITFAEDHIKIELQSWNWKTEYGYVRAEGEVKNISNKKLENIEALIKIYTKDGTFISSSSALIEYQSLLPGQTSPFTVMEDENPQMDRVEISFKKLFGGQMLYKEKKK